jgi:pimeloyl-ACP methyl ester carboxylesterase
MRNAFLSATLALSMIATSAQVAVAEPAIRVLGQDFVFPNKVEGLPAKLSDFPGLEIKSFVTNDGVTLRYWEAGQGRPLIFVPGWSANGAECVNVLYLLSKHYHVYVLDPRNQGLSQRVEYGGRISRFAMDLKNFTDHLDLKSADYCGWSMGASVVWSYIDLFGTKGVRKACFVDEPISIYSHDDWSEQERLDAGGSTTSAERMVAAFTKGAPVNSLITDMKPIERSMLKDAPAFANSESFANAFVKNDPTALSRVLFDHVTNDWRDVVAHKIDVPVAIFSGDESNNLPSQRWAASLIPGAKLYAYTASEQGDHFLMFKNPVKFTTDLRAFLDN